MWGPNSMRSACGPNYQQQMGTATFYQWLYPHKEEAISHPAWEAHLLRLGLVCGGVAHATGSVDFVHGAFHTLWQCAISCGCWSSGSIGWRTMTHRVFPSAAHLATVKCERQPVSRAEQQKKLCANALTPHTPHTLHMHIHTPRHTRMYRCWLWIGPAISAGKMLHTDTKINRLTVNAYRIRVDVCDKCLVDGEPKRLHCFAQLLLHSQGNLYNSPRDSDDQNAARDV